MKSTENFCGDELEHTFWGEDCDKIKDEEDKGY